MMTDEKEIKMLKRLITHHAEQFSEAFQAEHWEDAEEQSRIIVALTVTLATVDPVSTDWSDSRGSML